jgi:tetratricopeptide (TPR) repeat protein
MPCALWGSETGAKLLRKAQEERDPAKRIQLLDDVLADQSLTGRLTARAYFERGKAYKELKDCFRAIGDFNSALGLAGNRVSILMEKADCLIALEQLEQASDCIETVLLIETGKARPYILRGIIYEKQGLIA